MITQCDTVQILRLFNDLYENIFLLLNLIFLYILTDQRTLKMSLLFIIVDIFNVFVISIDGM